VDVVTGGKDSPTNSNKHTLQLEPMTKNVFSPSDTHFIFHQQLLHSIFIIIISVTALDINIVLTGVDRTVAPNLNFSYFEMADQT
jgi:hypothetical protein